jgi:hypothetical protein
VVSCCRRRHIGRPKTWEHAIYENCSGTTTGDSNTILRSNQLLHRRHDCQCPKRRGTGRRWRLIHRLPVANHERSGFDPKPRRLVAGQTCNERHQETSRPSPPKYSNHAWPHFLTLAPHVQMWSLNFELVDVQLMEDLLLSSQPADLLDALRNIRNVSINWLHPSPLPPSPSSTGSRQPWQKAALPVLPCTASRSS